MSRGQESMEVLQGLLHSASNLDNGVLTAAHDHVRAGLVGLTAHKPFVRFKCTFTDSQLGGAGFRGFGQLLRAMELVLAVF